MSLGNQKRFNVLIVLEHKLSILNLHYKKIEDVQSIYKTRYQSNILRSQIKDMLRKQIILFLQYNILLPQERQFVPSHIILFPQDRYFVPTRYYFTTYAFTADNRHKQNSRFCKEIREDNFRFWWRRVHEDASQGMYMSNIEICFFTARILLCCGECFHEQKHVQFIVVYELQLSQNQSSHEKHDENCDNLTFLSCS